MLAWWITGRLAAHSEDSEAQEACVQVLGQMLQARDHSTGDHTDRVTELALRMAGALAWSPAQTQALRWGALLHDIGKLTLPGTLLTKPGQLAPSERTLLRSHVERGLSLATGLEFLPDAALQGIRDHHERWDGHGYPAGRVAGEISVAGRIIALCDVYDALTSARPYKAAWTAQEALAKISAGAGRHFDPVLTPVFVSLLQHQNPQPECRAPR
ncbi:HD-GYP domain-containing protein (plasmid) [Deinococcus sp. D7000]|nr:HD-GYP domain-containing protein [Deinococcus sp. D7000]